MLLAAMNMSCSAAPEVVEELGEATRGGEVLMAQSRWGCKSARALLVMEWSSPSNCVVKSLRNKTLHSAFGRVFKFSAPLIQRSRSNCAILCLLCHPPPKNEAAAARPGGFAMCAGPQNDNILVLLKLFWRGRAGGNAK